MTAEEAREITEKNEGRKKYCTYVDSKIMEACKDGLYSISIDLGCDFNLPESYATKYSKRLVDYYNSKGFNAKLSRSGLVIYISWKPEEGLE